MLEARHRILAGGLRRLHPARALAAQAQRARRGAAPGHGRRDGGARIVDANYVTDDVPPIDVFDATQVAKVIPEAVGADRQGFTTLNDRALIAALVNAVKQQQVQIEELRAQVEALQPK